MKQTTNNQQNATMPDTRRKFSTQSLVMCAILTAFVIVLQLMGSFVRFGPFAVTLVLVPIVIGAALCGMWAGAWLGLVFGAVVLITDSAAFMAVSIIGTIVTVLAKGILAGAAAAAAYHLASRINRTAGVIAAALVCPIVNTGVFLIGCKLFFFETLAAWGAEAGFASASEYLIYGMIGGNFIFEVAVNMVLSPIIVRLIGMRKTK